MRAYIGYDPREPQAYDVAVSSLLKRSPGSHVVPLDLARLRSCGLFNRPLDRRGGIYDTVSGAAWSTEFALTRFLVPIISQAGWSLFADCDVVFMADVDELMRHADPTKAVMVVMHDHKPAEQSKMDGQAQTAYSRKNWSSVMLFNVDHPANKRLTVWDVNNRSGLDLHNFYWLHDSEIGALPPEWNWLVRVKPKPAAPKIAHFTLGGPFTPGWPGAEHDELWLAEAG